MRKISLFLFVALVLGLVTNLTIARASSSLDPEVQRVGLVVAYLPGQSITIVDRDGNQFTFELAPELKIVPKDRASMLGVGAYVTIIAPNNVPNGKHIAVGIVIHPQPPASFPIPTSTATPVPTEVAGETPTAVESPTVTVTATETPGGVATATETATPTGTPTGTVLSQPNAQAAVRSFVEWLASIFRQFLSTGG